MKTMKLDEKIVRVSDKEALTLENRGWIYIPKSEWKEKVRDIGKPEKSEKTEKKKGKQTPKGKAKKEKIGNEVE